MMVEILADFLILKYLFSPIKRIFCRGDPRAATVAAQAPPLHLPLHGLNSSILNIITHCCG
jgi:hypothetical protein